MSSSARPGAPFSERDGYGPPVGNLTLPRLRSYSSPFRHADCSHDYESEHGHGFVGVGAWWSFRSRGSPATDLSTGCAQKTCASAFTATTNTCRGGQPLTRGL
jgi:hypothetical protein